jgi:hypothetical protein
MNLTFFLEKTGWTCPRRRAFLRCCTVVLLLAGVFQCVVLAKNGPDPLPFEFRCSTFHSDGWSYVDSISMEGNKKTKSRLILRELEFGAGDSLRTADLLINLSLFNTVKFEQIPTGKPGHFHLHIVFIESWYIYPVPLFEIADRNFNVWWKEMNRSLRRVNIGLDCNHLNLTGNADLLKVKGQGGYSNKVELAYRKPNINRKQTLGLHNSILYNRQREVAVTTDSNKLDFRRNPNVWQIEQWHAYSALIWRPGLLNTHTTTLEYRRNHVTDSVAKILNPDFFLEGKTTQRHFSLLYNFTSDFRDARAYPWNGYFANIDLRINGLLPGDDLRLTRLFAEYFRFVPVHARVSVETGVKARLSLPRRKPPYFNNQGLGYGGTFVRGYEYYVVDGLDFAMARSAVHIRFFDRTFHLPKFLPKFTRNFPLKLYLSLNNDVGYVNDPHYNKRNPLANTWLFGNGFGIDIVAYNNKTAKLEYTRNHLGQWGFYVQANTGI